MILSSLLSIFPFSTFQFYVETCRNGVDGADCGWKRGTSAFSCCYLVLEWKETNGEGSDLIARVDRHAKQARGVRSFAPVLGER